MRLDRFIKVLVAIATSTVLASTIGATGVRFVANKGQWHELVQFRAKTTGVIVWFDADGALYQFLRSDDDNRSSAHEPRLPVVEQMTIRSKLLNANFESRLVGVEPLPERSNFLRGDNPDQWRTSVPGFRAIVREAVYPGIDLRYYATGAQIEYDFIVAPGADPAVIRIQYSGNDSLRINASGDLEIVTAWGTAVERAPVIYQTSATGRHQIAGRFQLASRNSFGFELEDTYDSAQPLVIDPVLVYSTFLGGSDVDEAYDIAVDEAGSVYSVGYTLSTDFPTSGEYQPDQVSWDVVVTKLNAAGDDLIYSTYLGGSGAEWGRSIAVAVDGSVYLTGFTESADFPTVNPVQGFTNTDDVFVSRLSAAGDSLIYSTWLGGSGNDWGASIAIDASGHAYVTGGTQSADFPTYRPYQATGTGDDAFVAKLDADGSALIYSTYLGGSAVDGGSSIAVDPAGNTYVAGYTGSSNFPVYNEYQSYQGFQDAFVTKLNAAGNSLVFSTYLGGSNHDEAYGLVVSPGNYPCVTGQTYSSDFPLLNARLGYQDNGDAFVTKLNATGNSLVFSTALGGSDVDLGAALAVDSYGSLHVIGDTYSADFPIHRPLQPYAGAGDLFVTKLPADGSRIVYSTCLGGNDTDEGNSIAATGTSIAYVAGKTRSTDFPTAGPYQLHQGDWDAFVTKLDANICCNNRVGNANGFGGDTPTLGDIAVMIDAKFISQSCDGLIDCVEEADLDQSGGVEAVCDDITLADISHLIDYLFITGSSLGLDDCL